jgi:hypothetical protein
VGSRNGVFAKGFVEIADPKQEHRAGVLLLELVVLAHERRVGHRVGLDVVGAERLDFEFFSGSGGQHSAVSFSLPCLKAKSAFFRKKKHFCPR